MAESLSFPQSGSRAEIYAAIYPQIEALVNGETDLIANLANITAVLKEAFGFFWVGFYLKKDQQLVLGPFQGPIACTRIDLNRGVCGYSYQMKRTIIVPNVDEFPGHIACSSQAKSEIVVPILQNQNSVGVLDVDSDRFNDFGEADQVGLEKIVRLIEENYSRWSLNR